MADPTYPLFPIFAFLGFFLTLLPLPWHLKAWNSGTCFFVMWASLSCLNQFINSVIWHNNAINWAPVWCDISIRIMLGSSVGIPAASLCINRRLYLIISSKSASISKTAKSRAILTDTLICVFLPLVFVSLQYIVQGHRFNIYEDFGCAPALYNTLPAYFISLAWPLCIGLASGVYCVLTLRLFTLRRLEFATILASHPSITIWRYFRLMALAATELLCTIPLSIFVIWINATTTPIEPWISWDDTHYAFSRVEQIPAVLWKGNSLLEVAMEFNRWFAPLCALVFFAFFGFAEEARKNYATWINGICSVLPKGSRFNPSSSSALKPMSLSSKGGYSSVSALPLPAVAKHKGLHVNVSVESISSKDTGTPITAKIFPPPTSHSPRYFVSSHDTLVQQQREPLLPRYAIPIQFPTTPTTCYSDTASIRTCSW